MKNHILLIFAVFISTFAFAQNQERLSVHYFDIPQSMEEEFMKFNKLLNQEIENAGFGKNFYKIYKVKADDEAKIYRYFQISSYTSDKHYDLTHDIGEQYDKISDEFWNSEIAKEFNKIEYIEKFIELRTNLKPSSAEGF